MSSNPASTNRDEDAAAQGHPEDASGKYGKGARAFWNDQPAASSVRQEVADRDELGSLVGWLRRGRTDLPMPDGCALPWAAALERILDHIDRKGLRYGR